MPWKELAIRLAHDKGHDIHCPFRGCMCGAVERQIEWIAEINRKMRDEQRTDSSIG